MKKIIYALVIVSMLVAAFGVKGVGVRSAAAAVGFNDDGTVVTDTALPRASTAFPGAGNAGGNQGGCSAVAVFGAYQAHLLSNDTTGVDHFIRARFESAADTGSYQWAVLIRNAATNIELGCAIAVGGVVDMLVPVEANVDVIVTLTNIGFYVPIGLFDYYLARNLEGAGLIVDMQADGGNVAARTLEASDTASDDFYTAVFDTNGFNVAFFDLPDGTYNLGVQDQTADAEFAAYYPGLTAPGIEDLTPDNDAVIPLTVQNTDLLSNPFNFPLLAVAPNDGGLNSDLELGASDQGAELLGEKTFSVNPGFLWDIMTFFDGGDQGLFVSLAFNPTLGTLFFDPAINPWTAARLCADIDYDDGDLIIDPPGALEPRSFDWDADAAPCPIGYSGGFFLLSENLAYEAVPAVLQESGWQYSYGLTTGIWNFTAIPAGVVPVVPLYDQIVGDAPFLTTPLPDATSAELYTLPLAAGEVALERGPWTDQDLNRLLSVVDTNPAPDVLYAPGYMVGQAMYAPIPWIDLANDWDTTDLGPITDVGRYEYWRGLYHGPLTNIGAGYGQGYFEYYDLFAIQPADMSMMTDWSWSWVMAMYEYDLTNGLNGGGYAPNAPVTRAQMAAFLARTLDLFGLAPTGAAPAFSDVPAAFWASAEIAFLRDYGITTGTDWCNGVAVTNSFCPNANVTRAEMAKFIEVTFRTIKVFGGFDFYWFEEQNIYTHGITFIDVPVDYWANIWVEEFFFDQLTDGCMRDGLNLYYCPGDDVTRGQMAKFIIRAIQMDFMTQGDWPILAPSK